MNIKIDTTAAGKKPDLKVGTQSPGKPGSFIVKGNEFIPNLKDKATAAREGNNMKKDKPEKEITKNE